MLREEDEARERDEDFAAENSYADQEEERRRTRWTLHPQSTHAITHPINHPNQPCHAQPHSCTSPAQPTRCAQLSSHPSSSHPAVLTHPPLLFPSPFPLLPLSCPSPAFACPRTVLIKEHCCSRVVRHACNTNVYRLLSAFLVLGQAIIVGIQVRYAAVHGGGTLLCAVDIYLAVRGRGTLRCCVTPAVRGGCCC